jgi:hypothetical protein
VEVETNQAGRVPVVLLDASFDGVSHNLLCKRTALVVESDLQELRGRNVQQVGDDQPKRQAHDRTMATSRRHG